MATTPDGFVVDEVNSGEEDPVPPRGVGKDDRGEPRTSPACSRKHGDGNPTGGVGACLHRGYPPNPLEPPSPIDQLVAELCDAGFNTNPRC